MLSLLTKKIHEEINSGSRITNKTKHLLPQIVKRYGSNHPELQQVVFDNIGSEIEMSLNFTHLQNLYISVMREKDTTEEQKNAKFAKIIEVVKRDAQGEKNSFNNANKVIGLYQFPKSEERDACIQ